MREPDPLRVHLVRSDAGFRQLAAQHEELDARLKELAGQSHPTLSEEQEQLTLKKRKLQLKDRMEQILRKYRDLSADASVAAASSHTGR